MNILLVAATELEIRPFIAKAGGYLNSKECPDKIQINQLTIDILITGVGLVFTSYKLTKALTLKDYDLIINAGIAGSFKRNLQIGDVVIIVQEEFGDLGIEDKSGFHSLFEKGFVKENEFPFEEACLKYKLPLELMNLELRPVKALSSNTSHGNELKIRQLENKFSPDIETMEGAAFFYVCLMEKANFIQLRAISNYVEARDISKWNIPLAIENLSVKLLKIIDTL
jgi:futalosine hydrolase